MLEAKLRVENRLEVERRCGKVTKGALGPFSSWMEGGGQLALRGPGRGPGQGQRGGTGPKVWSVVYKIVDRIDFVILEFRDKFSAKEKIGGSPAERCLTPQTQTTSPRDKQTDKSVAWKGGL